MKMITITKENFMQVAGRIKKFFDHHDVVTWHNFNCGGKRHIQGDFHFSIHNYFERKHLGKAKPVFRYSDVRVCIDPIGEPHIFDKPSIRLYLDDDNRGLITLGSKIAFCGNRIVLVSNASTFRNKNSQCYTVYQLWDPNGGFKNLKPQHSFGYRFEYDINKKDNKDL